jgi:hypothetical protein
MDGGFRHAVGGAAMFIFLRFGEVQYPVVPERRIGRAQPAGRMLSCDR